MIFVIQNKNHSKIDIRECLVKIAIKLFILVKNAIELTLYIGASLNSIIIINFATMTDYGRCFACGSERVLFVGLEK